MHGLKSTFGMLYRERSKWHSHTQTNADLRRRDEKQNKYGRPVRSAWRSSSLSLDRGDVYKTTNWKEDSRGHEPITGLLVSHRVSRHTLVLSRDPWVVTTWPSTGCGRIRRYRPPQPFFLLSARAEDFAAK